MPRAARLTGPSGSVVHAIVYPPANPAVRGPEGERPPYIVWVHGGPTSQVVPRLDLEKAYFTSRGIGIIDVNYGGSSGYGRAYRERLRGQWGVVDVADAMTAALALAESGEADGKRLGIRGGSAGGWTALAAVTSGIGVLERAERVTGGGVFAAVASYFGVADLRGFAEHTHDFESRYLDGLIGPLPECDALYAERAPVGHVNDATCPVLLLQGLDDPVVPPAQSESIAADLAAHGIPYAYITFEGESHGFRKAENIVASLEAELSFYGQIMGFTPPGVPRRAAGRTAESAGEFGGPGLADHGDADLARVGELLLDLLGDVAGDHLGLDVVDPVGLDHDPDLAAGLHGEDLLHAFVAAGDLLQPLQALDVHLQRLAPGARPAAAHRVRGLGEHRLDGADLDLVVVRLDGVHHVLRARRSGGRSRRRSARGCPPPRG